MLLKDLGIVGGLAAIAWALRPVWSAFADLIRGRNGGEIEKRIRELEGFKINAKQNHFHDLEELKEDRRDVWNAINAIRKDLNTYQLNMEGRISRLEARIFNGQK